MSTRYSFDDSPNIHIHSDEPDLPELKRELESAIADAGDYYDRAEKAIDARYCLWADQTEDGRKHGNVQTPPFPWEGASDTRIRTIDMIINERVDLMITALWRMTVQTIPTQAAGADWAGRMSSLLRWYLANQMADEADAEVELLANYIETFGASILAVCWHQGLSYEEKTVTVQEFLDASLQSGGPQKAAEFIALLTDPAQEEAAFGFVQSLSELLDKREARRVLDDLRTTGTATFKRPIVLESRPGIKALQPFQDVFFPVDTDRLQTARWVAQRELLTDPQLREKGVGHDAWDTDFIDAVLEQKGKMFNTSSFGFDMMTRYWGAGGAAGQVRSQEPGKDMYEVWHFHTRTVYEGLPAVVRTIMHPNVPDSYGLHGVLAYDHGQYPYIEFVRERAARTILSSRGLPEILDTHQGEIKVQRDSRTDRTSMTTLPPIKVKYRPGQKRNHYGPGVEVPVLKSEDIEPMQFGAPDSTSLEIERATKFDIDEYSGRVGLGIDPSLVTSRQQGIVTRWLRRWQAAGRQMLQLAQQYTEPQTIGRIVGVIPKPYQITREAIAGQFDLILTFDVRYANPEFLFKLMENLQKYVFSIDSNAVVNRDEMIRYVMESIDPTLADRVVRETEDASALETEDEVRNFGTMFAGAPVPMKMGQNYQARLNVLQQTLAANKVIQQLIPSRPDFRFLLEERIKFFTQQIEQEKNKVIGVYGTAPSAGSAGGPQLGGQGMPQQALQMRAAQ